MDLVGTTRRQVDLPGNPAVVTRYFSRNEALLRALVRGEVEVLPGGLYRVALGPYGVGGIGVAPTFDVAFEDVAGGITMRSHACRVREGSSPGLLLDASFEGEARFAPLPGAAEATRVTCWARAAARLQLPPGLAWGAPALETAGNALVAGVMVAFGERFARLVSEDFARWVGGVEA